MCRCGSRLRRLSLCGSVSVARSCSDLTFPLSPADGAGFVDLAFSREPQDTVVVRGGVLRLDCEARSDWSYPSLAPPSVSWRKDGVALGSFVDERRSQMPNGTLLIRNVVHSRHQRSDEGLYQCVAALEGIGSIASRTARVTVAGESWFRPGLLHSHQIILQFCIVCFYVFNLSVTLSLCDLK
uniref:Ig-like domain-containing protein n=1 Tax=Periophthalmus magnuspinnatus TaxID=409849 RepID=A0A3B3ZS42_9GOBI